MKMDDFKVRGETYVRDHYDAEIISPRLMKNTFRLQ